MKFINPLTKENTSKMYKDVFANTFQNKRVVKQFEEISKKSQIENIDIYHLDYDLNYDLIKIPYSKIDRFQVFIGRSVIDTLKHYYQLISNFKVDESLIHIFQTIDCTLSNRCIYFPNIDIFTDGKIIDDLMLFCAETKRNNENNEIYYVTSKKEFFKKHLWESYDKFMEYFEILKFIAL